MKTEVRLGNALIFILLAVMLAGCAVTKIKDVTSNPQKFAQRVVTLNGTVITSIPIPLTDKGLFEIKDQTGSIWVYTEYGVPHRGLEVQVMGKVYVGVTFVNRNFGIILVEEKEKKKP